MFTVAALFVMICWRAVCVRDHMNHANTNLWSLSSLDWPTYYELSECWRMEYVSSLSTVSRFLQVGREIWVTACMNWLCGTPFLRCICQLEWGQAVGSVSQTWVIVWHGPSLVRVCHVYVKTVDKNGFLVWNLQVLLSYCSWLLQLVTSSL